MKKTSSLKDNNPVRKNVERDIPVNTVVSQISRTDGEDLELTTRLTTQMARAVSMGHLFGSPISFNSVWVISRTDQLMRLAVSMGGEGRKDLIEALRAGGRVPDAAFGKGSGEQFYDVEDDDDRRRGREEASRLLYRPVSRNGGNDSNLLGNVLSLF